MVGPRAGSGWWTAAPTAAAGIESFRFLVEFLPPPLFLVHMGTRLGPTPFYSKSEQSFICGSFIISFILFKILGFHSVPLFFWRHNLISYGLYLFSGEGLVMFWQTKIPLGRGHPLPPPLHFLRPGIPPSPPPPQYFSASDSSLSTKFRKFLRITFSFLKYYKTWKKYFNFSLV